MLNTRALSSGLIALAAAARAVFVARRPATAVALAGQHGVAAHRAGRIRRTHRRCRGGRGQSVHHLRRRGVRRHLQERQQRRDVEAGLRQGRHVAVDRRSRNRALRSQCHLGGDGRAEQPPELVVGRRRLQVGRRRRDVDAHGSARHATTSAASSFTRPTRISSIVAALGHLWGPNDERGLYRTKDGGKTWDRVLKIDADTGVVDVAMDADGRTLFAAAYQRRRRGWGYRRWWTREWSVSIARRRRLLAEARRRAARGHGRPHRRRDLPQQPRHRLCGRRAQRGWRSSIRGSRDDVDEAEQPEPAPELLQPDQDRSEESQQALEARFATLRLDRRRQDVAQQRHRATGSTSITTRCGSIRTTRTTSCSATTAACISRTTAAGRGTSSTTCRSASTTTSRSTPAILTGSTAALRTTARGRFRSGPTACLASPTTTS